MLCFLHGVPTPSFTCVDLRTRIQVQSRKSSGCGKPAFIDERMDRFTRRHVRRFLRGLSISLECHKSGLFAFHTRPNFWLKIWFNICFVVKGMI